MFLASRDMVCVELRVFVCVSAGITWSNVGLGGGKVQSYPVYDVRLGGRIGPLYTCSLYTIHKTLDISSVATLYFSSLATCVHHEFCAPVEYLSVG